MAWRLLPCCLTHMPGGSFHLLSVSRDSHPLQPSYRYDLLDDLLASLTLKPIHAKKLSQSLKNPAPTAQVRRAAPQPLTPTRTRRACGHS